MAMTDEERRQMLAGLGLEPEGETLTVAQAPEPEAQATVTPAQALPSLDDVPEHLADDAEVQVAFDRLKATRQTVPDNATRKAFNSALWRRLGDVRARTVREGRAAAREASAAEATGYVKAKVAAGAQRTADHDALAQMLVDAGVTPDDFGVLAQMIAQVKAAQEGN